MKKRNVYITGAVLSLGMLAGLTGCGSKDSENAEAATTGTSAEDNLKKAAEEIEDSTGSGDKDDSRKKDKTKSDDSQKYTTKAATTGVKKDVSDLFSDRDLDGSYDASTAETITLSGTSASVSGTGATVGAAADGAPAVTVSKAGTYVVSGTLSDGQIIVDVGSEDKVQLVLSGVTMTNNDSACIYVKNADKVFVTLAEGTVNTLSDTGTEYTQTDSDTTVDGVIYARDDISFNGTGTLTIDAKYKHAIVGKDDLKVASGTYNLTAAGKGISANDSIRIKSGTFQIKSGDDALHTSNGEEEDRGYIYIADGSFEITAGDDGIHAETDLIIDGGSIQVKESKEGLEGYTITINDGEIRIVSSDDGLNAAGGSDSTSGDSGKNGQNGHGGGNGQAKEQTSDGTDSSAKGDVNEGKMDPPTDQNGQTTEDGQKSSDGQNAGDGQEGGGRRRPGFGNGQMPDFGNGEMPDFKNGERPEMPDGEMPDFKNGERPEMPDGEMPDFKNGERPEMPNGEMPDFKNGEMPNGGGDFGGGKGGMMDTDENAILVINGGNIYVNAGGDGLDSNGYFTINGGVIYVSGPTQAMNGALDSGIDFTINGGSVIAAGSTGMDENFGSNSTQYSIRYRFDSSRTGGTEVQLLDSDGTAIMKYTPEKDYSSVVFSSKEIKAGTYTVKAGTTEKTVTVSEIVTNAEE